MANAIIVPALAIADYTNDTIENPLVFNPRNPVR